MRTYTAVYESILSFHLLPIDEINASNSVLIQIFSTYGSYNTAIKVMEEAQIFFPQAIVVGLSSLQCIIDDKAKDPRTVVAISTFEHTTLTVHTLEEIADEKSFEAGKTLAKRCLKKDTRLFLLYADGLSFCAERLLQGVVSTSPDLPVAGMLAADRMKFEESYLFHQGRALFHAAILIGFHSERLKVAAGLYQSIKPVGPPLRIDEAKECVVTSLEGVKPLDLYRHYLGEKFADHLPAAGMEISLAKEGSEHPLSIRSVTKVYEDGSFRFAGILPEGSHWRFSHFDPADPFEFCPPTLEGDRIPETIFLFADAAHTLVESGTFHDQISYLSSITKVAGAYGYGEFYSFGGKTEMLNQSLLTVALSESDERLEEPYECLSFREKRGDDSLLAESLAFLGHRMIEKARLTQSALQTLMEELPMGVLFYDTDLKLLEANDHASNLLGLDIRLATDKKLDKLTPWIVELFRHSFDQKIHTRIGKIMDPVTGKSLQVKISTLTLCEEEEAVGGIAFLESM